MKKVISALLALTLTVSSMPSYVNAAVADSYDMTVTVDMTSSGKAISPYIYGINQYGHQNDYSKVKVNTVRQGGNRMTAYNWETNAMLQTPVRTGNIALTTTSPNLTVRQIVHRYFPLRGRNTALIIN